MSALDPLRFSPWTSSPGLYSIHNVDTHKVLDQGNSEGDEHQITCWYVQSFHHGKVLIYLHSDGEPSLNITNPNQLWLLVIASDEKWLLINKRSGAYLAATDPNHAVVAQVGHPDWSSALWKVLPAECGGLWAIV